jgi:hypothetical protein
LWMEVGSFHTWWLYLWIPSSQSWYFSKCLDMSYYYHTLPWLDYCGCNTALTKRSQPFNIF